MSDAILRALERDALHDQDAREALWRARVRLGLGWSGERLPDLLAPADVPGLYRTTETRSIADRAAFVLAPAVMFGPEKAFYVSVYPVCRPNGLPLVEPWGVLSNMAHPYRLPSRGEANQLLHSPSADMTRHMYPWGPEAPIAGPDPFNHVGDFGLLARVTLGPGPQPCFDAAGPMRPASGGWPGRLFATAERPHGVGPFDLLGNVWEWDSEGGLYGGLARNRTGGFRLVVDAVA